MADAPERIQRRRTKGWRMPEGVVYVGRGSRWGNPFAVGKMYLTVAAGPQPVVDAEQAVRLYREAMRPLAHQIRQSLQGKTLACWCALDQPCHADVLLEIANA